MSTSENISEKIDNQIADILVKEALLLPKLEEITLEGVSLNVIATKFKEKSEKIKSTSAKAYYRPEVIDLSTVKDKEKNLLLDLENTKKLIETVSLFKSNKERYLYLQQSPRHKEFPSLYVCANDYIKREVSKFKAENNLKYLDIVVEPEAPNWLSEISVRVLDSNFTLSNTFSSMDLSYCNLTIEMDKFDIEYPTYILKDFQGVLDRINNSLAVIDKMEQNITNARFIPNKNKRNTYIKECEETIVYEKERIYQNYSRLLTAKEKLAQAKVLEDKENKAVLLSEMKDELKSIVNFLEDKLNFELVIKGKLFN